MKPTEVEIARAKSEVLRRERVLLVPQFEAIAAEFGQTATVTVTDDAMIIGEVDTPGRRFPVAYRLHGTTSWTISPGDDPFFASGITDVVEAWTEACSKWFGPRQSVVDQLVAEMTERGKQS